MQTEAFSAIGNGPFPAAAVKGHPRSSLDAVQPADSNILAVI
jgi:hypothetical protein